MLALTSFHGCRYQKGSGTGAEPDHVEVCPLPRHNRRNGQLNQTAFSLFLFTRNVIGGDLVGWIDGLLAAAEQDPRWEPPRPRSGPRYASKLSLHSVPGSAASSSKR